MSSEPGQRRILIIDDQEPTRYIFRRILTHAGFAIEEAETGSLGLVKVLSQPDLIILDVNLPDMLGYEVCRRIKSNPLTKSIPVLQISASFVSDESKVQALKEGADSYLTQPVEPTVLLAQVAALLRLRQAESLSHLSALQWQTTFDALSDGLALADANGNVLRANASFLGLFDLVSSEITGKSMNNVFVDAFELSLPEFIATVGERKSTELSVEGRWFRVRYDAIQSDPNNESGSILIVTDITDQKKLQETLKLSERLAATGRLAHIIAHEINNPLEAMSNLLFLAGAGTPDRYLETQAYVNQASEELHRISRITKQVLAYHRESVEPVPTAADEMLEGVLAMFASQLKINQIELVAHLNCSKKLRVHPGEVRQVLNNLVANALDAMNGSSGILRVRCMPSVHYPNGIRGVRFLCSDTGTGIPESILPRIFDAFYTTKEAKGSGIGLWLSSEVIEKHKGYSRVRTRTEGPYRGTLIDVFLPLPL